MTCPRCNNTGEGSGQYSVLDCAEPGCTAATERAALNAWIDANRPDNPYDERWAVYQYVMRLCEEKIDAQMERDRKDAERYRWLREDKNTGCAENLIGYHSDVDLDAAIDAELSKNKKEIDAG